MDLLPFINDLFIEVDPIPVKEAMNCLGFNVGGYRAPLDYMAPNNKDVLIAEIERVKELIY
jgi:4-hydroxy-tetrahydrodipicolinate synthase